MTDSDGNEIMLVSDYTDRYQTISQSVCVGVSPGCFKLTLTDSYGDGISGNDAIKAYFDWEEIYRSGSLPSSFSTHTVDIGNGCSSGQYPSHFPSLHPSSAPVSSKFPSHSPSHFPSHFPSQFPISYPSSHPVSGNYPSHVPSQATTCDGKVLTVSVQTDRYY